MYKEFLDFTFTCSDHIYFTCSKCKDCKSAIEDGISINAYGSVWHPQCFCCLRCREPIAMNEVFNHINTSLKLIATLM